MSRVPPSPLVISGESKEEEEGSHSPLVQRLPASDERAKEIPTFALALAESTRNGGPQSARGTARGSLVNLRDQQPTAPTSASSSAALSPSSMRGGSVADVRRRRDTNSPELPARSSTASNAGMGGLGPSAPGGSSGPTPKPAGGASTRRRSSFTRTGSVGKLKSGEPSPKVKEDGAAFSTLSLELARLTNEVTSLKQRLSNQQRAHESEQATAVSVAIDRERLERDRRLKAVASSSAATVRAAQDEMLRGFEKRFSAFQASLGDHQLLHASKMKEAQVKELAAHVTLQEMLLAVQRNEIHALERQLASGHAGVEAAATFRELLKDAEAKHASQLTATQKSLADSVQAQETTHELLQVYLHRCTDQERTIENEREEARVRQEELVHLLAQTRHVSQGAFATLAGQYHAAAVGWSQDRAELFGQFRRKDEVIARQDESIARLLYENSQLLKQLQALGVFSMGTQTHTETAAKITADRVRAGIHQPTDSKETSPLQATTTLALAAQAATASPTASSSAMSPQQHPTSIAHAAADALSPRLTSATSLAPSNRPSAMDVGPNSPTESTTTTAMSPSSHRPHSPSAHSFDHVRFLEANFKPIHLPQVGVDPFAFAASLPPGTIADMPAHSMLALGRRSPRTGGTSSASDHSPQSSPRAGPGASGSGSSVPPSPMHHGARSTSGSPFARGSSDGRDPSSASAVLHQAKISSRVPVDLLLQWPQSGHSPMLGVHGASHAVSFMRDLNIAEDGPTATHLPGMAHSSRASPGAHHSHSSSLASIGPTSHERTPLYAPHQQQPTVPEIDIGNASFAGQGFALESYQQQHQQHQRHLSRSSSIAGTNLPDTFNTAAAMHRAAVAGATGASAPSHSRPTSLYAAVTSQYPQAALQPDADPSRHHTTATTAALSQATNVYQRPESNFLNTVDSGSNLLPIGLSGQPVAPMAGSDLPQEMVSGLSQEWRQYQAAKSAHARASAKRPAYPDVERARQEKARLVQQREEEKKRARDHALMNESTSTASLHPAPASGAGALDSSRPSVGRGSVALHYVSPQLDIPAPLASPEERHLHPQHRAHQYPTGGQEEGEEGEDHQPDGRETSPYRHRHKAAHAHPPIRAHPLSPPSTARGLPPPPPTDGLSHKAHALIAAAIQTSLPISYHSQTNSSGTKVHVQVPSTATPAPGPPTSDFVNNSISVGGGGGSTGRGRERQRDLRGKRMKPAAFPGTSAMQPQPPPPPSQPHPNGSPRPPAIQNFGHRSVSHSPEPNSDASPIASEQ